MVFLRSSDSEFSRLSTTAKRATDFDDTFRYDLAGDRKAKINVLTMVKRLLQGVAFFWADPLLSQKVGTTIEDMDYKACP